MRALPLCISALVLVACSDPATSGSGTLPAADASMSRTAPSLAGDAGTAPTAEAPAAAATRSSSRGIGGSGELLNPDGIAMVLLYHRLAGISAPIDQWVDDDSRVTTAPGAQKSAQREQVRAELHAAMAAVENIGFIRLTINDQLSEYDPGYGEFTLRALAPSSTVGFKALHHEVVLRFGNGRDAQIWAVPPDRAQSVQDSFRYGRDIVLDLLLQVTGVQPGPRGGTLVTDVLEYEIRTLQGNQLLARVKPPTP